MIKKFQIYTILVNIKKYTDTNYGKYLEVENVCFDYYLVVTKSKVVQTVKPKKLFNLT